MNDTHFQLALGGDLPEAVDQAALVLEQAGAVLEALGEAGNGLQLLISPSYTGEGWASWAGTRGLKAFGVLKDGDTPWPGECVGTLVIDTAIRSAAGEALCNAADLVLAVWDEDVAQRFGAVWELIELCRRHGTPCVWISSRTGTLYWVGSSCFEELEPEKLRGVIAAHGGGPLEPAPDTQTRIPLLKLGQTLRRAFLNKYRAEKAETTPEKDRLLLDSFSMESEGAGCEPARRKLLDKFRAFDKAAVGLNSQYQAVTYWRAVLPFLATVFLAVGFYAETILSVTSMSSGLRAAVAGTGFLIHGLLNLYVFFLSRNRGVKEKQRAFIENRYKAEILRVLIHLAPYGIGVDLRTMCGESDAAAFRRLAAEDRPSEQKLDAASSRTALGHIDEMLQDQISYHRASAERYSRVVTSLDRWNKVIFTVGFVTVILRALLQFYVSLFPLVGSINGADLNGYVRSFANMAALLLPGWASYFATKMNLCNFRYNLDNHTRMSTRLTAVLDRVRGLEERESVPVDVMGFVAEDVSRSMIQEDTMAWEHKLGDFSVTAL